MRSFTFLIVFSIIMLIYFLANYYLYVRGLQAFSLNQPMKRWYMNLFWTLVLSFVAGSVLERTFSSAFSEWVYRVGSFWLAFMLYLIIAVILIDIVRIFNYFFHFLPGFSPIHKFRMGLAVVALVSVVVIAGHVNALWINVKNIPLTIGKKVSGNPEVKILMALRRFG
jgi:uncharacterized protein